MLLCSTHATSCLTASWQNVLAPLATPPLSDTPPAALPILFSTNSKVVEKTHLHPNILLLLDEGIHWAKASSSDIRLAKGSLGLARRNYWMLIH